MKSDDKHQAVPPAPNPPSRKSLPPFEALRAFDAVARLGGVRKAAQSLYRDHAVISRHLRAMEAWTGATLVDRTAAGVVLTDVDIRFVATYLSASELPSELRGTDLISVPIIAVASRGYLEQSTPIREPHDLLNHKLLHEENFNRWANWLAAHSVHADVDLTGPLLWQGHL